MKIGSIVTLLAIACAAFFVADVAHEGLGHGGACLALRGRMLSLSTTYESCSIHSRWIDGAGPGVGLLVALLAWAWLRFAPPRSQSTRVFLSLLFGFTIFWNVGYMIYSGLLDRGDWKFVVQGLEPAAAWRAALAVCGIVFYAMAMRASGAMVSRNLASSDGWRPQSFALIAVLCACVLAAAGAAFDPRGPAIMLSDALPSALSSLGLVWGGRAIQRRRPKLRIATPISPGWMVTGLACAVIFIVVLGPAVRF